MLLISTIIILGILLSEILKRNQNNETSLWKKIVEILGMDLRALALFRISLGFTLIYDLSTRLKDLTEHYTDIGIMPRAVLENAFPYNSFPYIYMITGSSIGTALLFSIHIILAILLILGIYTKFVTPLLWYFTVSLHYRNLLVCFGGDNFFHTLLFWGMFLPLGDRWSIDGLITKKESKNNSIISFGTIALTLQIILLYVISTEHKYSPEWRDEGSAIYYALSYDLYLRPLGKIIYNLHLDSLLKAMTTYVYWLERVGPFLLLSPIYTSASRLLIIFLIVSMHLGINICLNVGYFGLVSCVAMIPFIPPIYMDKLVNSLKDYFKDFANKFNSIFSFMKKEFKNEEIDVIPLELKNVIVSICLYFVFVQNLSNINPKTFSVPKELSQIAKIVYLEQNWGMFSPGSLKSNWWLVMPGKLKDGSIVDIFKQNEKLDWEKPPLVEKTFKSYRTSVYLNNLFAYGHNWETNLTNYGNFLCHNWNIKHSPKKALEDFEVYYIFEDNLKSYNSGLPQKRLSWKHFCGMKKEDQDKMWRAINSNEDLTSKTCNIDASLNKLKENLNYLNSILGENHPVSIRCLLKLAEGYMLQKKYKDAENIYKVIIMISEKNFGENQLFTASVYYYLSEALLKQGKIEESTKIKDLSISELKKIAKENHTLYLESIKRYSESIENRECKDTI